MAEELVKRIPPHSIEAEQSVLGCCLYSPDAIITAAEYLRGEDFYQHSYGVMFDTLYEMNASGKATDIVSLQAELRKKDIPAEAYDIETLKGLVNGSYVTANIRSYATIVQEKSQLRRLIKTSEELTNAYYQDKEATSVLLDRTEKNIFDILQKRTDRGHQSISDITLATINKIEEAAKNGGGITGIRSGFTGLDHMLLGFHPSEYTLIAARPSMGKTAFALNIALHMATRENKKVALFELEMAREDLVLRLMAMEACINSKNLRSGELTDADWSDILHASQVIAASGLIIDDTPGISLSELRTKCKRFQLEEGLDCVIVDYIGLMSMETRRSDSLVQQIQELSKGLKSLARELKVPVIALSQLSRGPEQRTEHRPQMSDLRDSGSLEQDADVIMFIYRDEVYDKNTEKKNIAEIIISKQRNGETGTIELKWQPEFTKFYNLERPKPQNREE